MAGQNDILLWATGVNANILTQAAYISRGDRDSGAAAGVASAQQFNKTLRQTTIMSRMIAQFIIDRLGNVDVIDDGTTATIEANFILAIRSLFVIPNTGVVPGTYGPTVNIVVQADGRITSLANRGLDATGVAAGNYGPTTNLTVLTDGRISSISNAVVPSDGLINVQRFTTVGTFTYTPTANTKSVVVEVQGGGAAGAGSVINAAFNGESLGTPGTSGAYAMARFTSLFSGVTVTVGGRGLGVAGANGQNGSASSFGALVSCPGGMGGISSIDIGANIPLSGGNGNSVFPTGANMFPGASDNGSMSVSISPSCAYGGSGGRTPKGGGAAGQTANVDGNDASTPGAGGSGTANFNNGVTQPKGGAGAAGYVVVWEYGT